MIEVKTSCSMYCNQLHKPVQLETQLKTALHHTLRWTMLVILTNRKQASIRFAKKCSKSRRKYLFIKQKSLEKLPTRASTIMMVVLQQGISNCAQSLCIGGKNQQAVRAENCVSIAPLLRCILWHAQCELLERGAWKLSLHG